MSLAVPSRRYRKLQYGAAACLLACVACGVTEAPPPVRSLSQGIGEPMNGYPSPVERLGLMAINRARSDPSTLKGPNSAIYPAVAPIQFSYALSRSSRFHATNLELSNVTLMHTSPCPLDPNVANTGCMGDPSCACASSVPSQCANCAQVSAINSCGTDTFTRIGYFTASSNVGSTGEVAAAGYSDPMATVDGWVDEAAGADGHRQNLLDVSIQSNVMGYGHAEGSGCWSPFDVSDSGQDGTVGPVNLPTAAANPPSGSGSVTFYATWADPSGGAPSALSVVVDGQCQAMTRELGDPSLNATYLATVNLSGGCHTWWILGTDAGGGRHTYPSTGALTAGDGCSQDWQSTQPQASCEGVVHQPDFSTTAPLDFSVRPNADLAGNPSRDFATSSHGDASLHFSGGASGCGCTVGARGELPLGSLLASLALLLVALALRRR